MAKAHITTKHGTEITIEGTPEEVAFLAERLSGGVGAPTRKDQKQRPEPKSNARPTPVNLISELVDGGFFKTPRELGAIKVALEEQGHFFPVTTLSPALLRLVRKKTLRRIKDKKRWTYVS
jgi:hypothetical protein